MTEVARRAAVRPARSAAPPLTTTPTGAATPAAAPLTASPTGAAGPAAPPTVAMAPTPSYPAGTGAPGADAASAVAAVAALGARLATMMPDAAGCGPAPGTRLIAIASGKGGVGKTWFAITLAHALAQQGHRVLLFDADLGLANVDVQLGLTPPLDLADVIAGRASIAEAALPHPDGGFHVLAGRSGSGMFSGLPPATLERTLTSLRSATAGFDVVLLDLGAGLAPAVRRMAAFADTLLVLLTEEPTSLTDAYAVLKLHTADCPGGDARIIVNQAASRAAADHAYAALRRACATFLGHQPPLAGVIRRDERVRDAIRRQALLLIRHPTSAAATDVSQIACALLK